MNFFLQNKPSIVPATDGKLIEEHFGRSSTNQEDISIARMVAPPRWGEPHQSPTFDEWTLICSGRKCIEIDGQCMVLETGQSMLIKAGARVRYSNPFDEPCVYWSVCTPAFSIESVNREE